MQGRNRTAWLLLVHLLGGIAAMADEALGVQHIFIYCGTFGTPTGIYRITRTLDTGKFGEVMRQQGAAPDSGRRPR